MDHAAAVHEPVMVAEVVNALGCRPGGFWVDATLGAGGHAAAILERTAPDGFVLGIDATRILSLAATRPSRQEGSNGHGNFGELRRSWRAGGAGGRAADRSRARPGSTCRARFLLPPTPARHAHGSQRAAGAHDL
jgi:16S rRNA C1402 N4-methylase RsmH